MSLTEHCRVCPNGSEWGRIEPSPPEWNSGVMESRGAPCGTQSAGSCDIPVTRGSGARFVDKETEAPGGSQANLKALGSKKWRR